MKIAKSVNRLGTEAVYNIFAKTKQLVKEGRSIIDLSLGQSDFKSPKYAVDGAIKALKDGHHGYTPSNGILELREAVSQYIYETYKVEINPENILITPGGKPTIFFSALIFGHSQSEIIYPDPGFPIYKSMIKFSGAKPVPIELKEENNFEIDIEHLASLITDKTNLIIINNPHNPTGSFMDKHKITQLVRMLDLVVFHQFFHPPIDRRLVGL